MVSRSEDRTMKSSITNLLVIAVSAMVVFTTALVADKPGYAASGQDFTAGKKYLDMSDAERRRYVELRAAEIARALGLNGGGEVTPAAVDEIKLAVDVYASRIHSPKKLGCGFGDNLQAAYERASFNAPFIIESFTGEKVEPRIGLYLAMVESAHCPCLQSQTGALGLFQLTRLDARKAKLNTFAEASTLNPDDRCGPSTASLAAARRLKAIARRYGSSELSLAMAIVAFDDPEAFKIQPDEFWQLVSRGDTLVRRREESRRLSAFIAAAIVGENPQDFGLNLKPISNYSR